MEYLIAVSVLVLIVSLIGLVGVMKKNKSHKKSIGKYIKHKVRLEKELDEEKKSNSANNWWNTKYRETIEEQADTIRSLSCAVDESHVVVEAIANNKSKKERLELANKYKFNEK